VPEETGVKLPPPVGTPTPRGGHVAYRTDEMGPVWDGTSMSERLGLGVADGESRWIGVRRHQAILAIAGLGLVGEWVTQVHRVLIELVLGAALFSCALRRMTALPSESEFVLRSNLAFVHGGHRFARRYTTMS